MKKSIYLIAFLVTGSVAQAQDCIVAVDSLKGQYTGDCKKGKADGIGTATGADAYTGHFKNGLPDGAGKYTWRNGNWYDGLWKDGLFDGQGTLHTNSTDSTKHTTGFWKKGKFIGKYEKPYRTEILTNNFSEVSVRKLNSTEADITITVKSITGGGMTLHTVEIPKARLIGIQQIEGRYEQLSSDESSSTLVNTYTLRKVTYPFYATFSLQTVGSFLQPERVSIEILEAGNWYVRLGVEN